MYKEYTSFVIVSTVFLFVYILLSAYKIFKKLNYNSIPKFKEMVFGTF